MTCIVAYRTAEAVFMGADSAGVAGLSMTVRADRKVFELCRAGVPPRTAGGLARGDRDRMLVGFTSSFRMGQIIQHHVALPDHPRGVPTFDWMVREFVPAVRKALKEHAFTTVNNNVETGGSFLVAYRNRIYTIDGDFQVGEPVAPFDAVGCGASIALGAMDALHRWDTPGGIQLVELALQAAERHSAGVRRPFHTEVLWKQRAAKR